MRSESSLADGEALCGESPRSLLPLAATVRSAARPPAASELHGRRQNALRPAEAAEVLGEKGAVRGGQSLEDEGLQVLEVSLEAHPSDELVLTHRVQLFDGVVEVVRDRAGFALRNCAVVQAWISFAARSAG